MRLFGLIMAALTLVSSGFSLGVGIERQEHAAELAKADAVTADTVLGLKQCTETVQRHDREWEAAAHACMDLVELWRAACR